MDSRQERVGRRGKKVLSIIDYCYYWGHWSVQRGKWKGREMGGKPVTGEGFIM